MVERYLDAAKCFGDIDGDSLLSVLITTLPTSGSLLLNGGAIAAGTHVQASDIAAGQLTYAPAPSAVGPGQSSFTFQVQDDGGIANGGVELVTGDMQVGNDQFTDRDPANVNVAGDANDPNGPTYATFGAVLDAAPGTTGAAVTAVLSRDGQVSDDPALVAEGVTNAMVDEVTNHSIAAPFWDFMISDGLVYENAQTMTAELFESLDRYKAEPLEMVRLVSAGMNRFPLVKMGRYEWLVSTDPNASIGTGRPASW